MNLAPNGKPSNLTPEQYLLVRTPAFKAWFGFWDLYGKSKNYYDYGVREIAIALKSEKEYAIKEAVEFLSIQVTKDDVLIPMPSRIGIATDTKKLAEEIAKKTGAKMFNCLVGIERESISELKKSNKNITKFDFKFELNCEIPKARNYFIVDNVIGTGITMKNALQQVIKNIGAVNVNPLVYAIDVKNISKLVDDNGEPLTCFHGSNNEFNVFEEKYLGSSNDMGFYGQGFYFTFQKDEKWMKFAIGEASYYGKIVKPYFIKALNPFIFGELKKYKGIRINFIGTQSLVFLNNIAKIFPQLAEKITLDRTAYNRFTKENEITQVPISILPDLIDKYSEDLKIIEQEDRGEIKINGYLKSKTKEVFYDYTESGGKKGSYVNFDTLSYGIDSNNKKESIEILLIEAALEKYEGIEVRYNPEGYMTRFPEITDAIKENHDCIMQGETGDELVVFKPTQIKLSDGTNTTFDSNNPDIRYAQGGGLDKIEVKIIDNDILAEKVYDIIEDDLAVGVPRLALLENNKVIGGIYLEPANSYVLDGKRTVEPLYEYKFDIYIKRSKRKKGYSKLLLDAMIKDFIDNFPDADQIRGDVINKKLEKSLQKNYGFNCDSGNQEEITYCYLSRESAIKYLKSKFSNGGTLIEKDIFCSSCGWGWNKHESQESDVYICHKCGTDNNPAHNILKIEQVEIKLGRKLDSWNDDIVYLDGIKYKKVYLRPEYKKVI
jgi:predicted amidophosphoribosyltransferase